MIFLDNIYLIDNVYCWYKYFFKNERKVQVVETDSRSENWSK